MTVTKDTTHSVATELEDDTKEFLIILCSFQFKAYVPSEAEIDLRFAEILKHNLSQSKEIS